MPGTIGKIICARCHGGTGDACPDCAGFGWLWSDGVVPVLCPGGGRNPLVRSPRVLPCGRRNETCPGCDRTRAEIDAANAKGGA